MKKVNVTISYNTYIISFKKESSLLNKERLRSNVINNLISFLTKNQNIINLFSRQKFTSFLYCITIKSQNNSYF